MPGLIPASFYDRDPVLVARELLGMTLVGREGTAGVIVETEAYHQDEAACHAFRGRTPRTDALFGPPGTAYIYFTYGMHWCFNAVCEAGDIGAAVLIRALVPARGIEQMHQRRAAASSKKMRDRDLCSGPAKLVQALNLLPQDNGCDLTATARVPAIVDDAGVRDTTRVDVSKIVAGPRVGISNARDLPWRFGVAGSNFISRPF